MWGGEGVHVNGLCFLYRIVFKLSLIKVSFSFTISTVCNNLYICIYTHIRTHTHRCVGHEREAVSSRCRD